MLALACLLPALLSAGCFSRQTELIPALAVRYPESDPYPQFHELPWELDQAWREAVAQINRRPIQRLLVVAPHEYLVTWTEAMPWSQCTQTLEPQELNLRNFWISGVRFFTGARIYRPSSGPATVVWVMRLSQALSGSRMFVRATCFHHLHAEWPPGRSLGMLESALVSSVRDAYTGAEALQ